MKDWRGEISRSVEAGLAGLARSSPLTLSVHGPRGVRTCESTFGTANILLACAGVPRAGAVLGHSTEYLLQRREEPGVWRFSPGQNPALPPDVDCSACAVAALLLWGVRVRPFWSDDALISALVAPEGGWRTWCVSSEEAAPRRENEVDVVVNVNVLYALAVSEHERGAVERYVLSRVRESGLACWRGSKYYRSPFVVAYFLARWLARENGPQYPRLGRWLAAEVQKHCQDCELNCFDASLALKALRDAARVRGNDLGETTQRRLCEAILGGQAKDGLWGWSPFFVDPAGNAYGSSALTTAFCLEALSDMLS